MRTRTSQAATARRLDLAVAVLISILGVAVWIETGTWFEARNLAQDPTVLPRSIAVTLWLVAVGMVVKVVSARRSANRSAPEDEQHGSLAPAAAEDAADDESGSFVGAVVAILAMCVYVWLAFRLGWIVVTWAFLTGTVLFLGRDRWSRSGSLVAMGGAAIAVAVLWFGFIEMLGVRMPSTLLP